MTERVVPVLRSGDPAATIAFWQALGFEVLHDQRRPYLYLSLRRGGFQVDYASGVEGTAMALVMAEDVDALHVAFRDGLRASMGRVPRSGAPRLGALSRQKRDRRFTLVDPDGHHFIVIAPETAAEDLPRTPLARALKAARLSAYGQGDLDWAAGHLDEALAAPGEEAATLRLAALALRADVAVLQGQDPALWIAQAEALSLTAAERGESAEALNLLADLRERA